MIKPPKRASCRRLPVCQRIHAVFCDMAVLSGGTGSDDKYDFILAQAANEEARQQVRGGQVLSNLERTGIALLLSVYMLMMLWPGSCRGLSGQGIRCLYPSPS